MIKKILKDESEQFRAVAETIPDPWDAPIVNPTQVLLQDELKLKPRNNGTLEAQIEKALTLLYWLKQLTATTSYGYGRG
ncbi:MAG: hypothetical protein F6K19_43215 [Cyanothece sp. SIO1E1]|nr:hypothetical protein [Cyanothece sp. SIO1E1]